MTSTASDGTALVSQLDERAVGTVGDAGWHAATDGDERPGDDRVGDRGDDVVPLALEERRSRLVDHRRSAARLDDDGGAADLAVDGNRGDVEPFGAEQVRGDAAEPARERPDERGPRGRA